MRRLARHLFVLCSAVSLVMFMALLLFTVRGSVPVPDSDSGFEVNAGKSTIHFWSSYGTLRVSSYRVESGIGVEDWRWDTWAVWPLFLTAACPAVLGMGYVRRHRAERLVKRWGRCPLCGYDVRATPHRCPECGT